MFPNYYKMAGTQIVGTAALNLSLPDIPDKFTIHNLMSGANEIFKIEWFKNMGDAKEIQFKRLADNGSTGGYTIAYVSSGGYISQYNANAMTDGTDASTVAAVVADKHTKAQGITISADWLDDNDVIYWEAEFNVPFIDGGDTSA